MSGTNNDDAPLSESFKIIDFYSVKVLRQMVLLFWHSTDLEIWTIFYCRCLCTRTLMLTSKYHTTFTISCKLTRLPASAKALEKRC